MDRLTLETLPEAFLFLSNEVSEIKKLLLQNQSYQTTEDYGILTLTEAAKLLHLEKSTIYGLVNKSLIPYMKKGKRLYFSKNDLINWLKEGKRKTTKEIDMDTDEYLFSLRK